MNTNCELIINEVTLHQLVPNLWVYSQVLVRVGLVFTLCYVFFKKKSSKKRKPLLPTKYYIYHSPEHGLNPPSFIYLHLIINVSIGLPIIKLGEASTQQERLSVLLCLRAVLE